MLTLGSLKSFLVLLTYRVWQFRPSGARNADLYYRCKTYISRMMQVKGKWLWGLHVGMVGSDDSLSKSFGFAQTSHVNFPS